MATSFATARTTATNIPLALADLNKSLTITAENRFNVALEGLRKARTAIEQKRIALGGATGQPTGEVDFGAGDGYYRRFQNGIIYLLPPAAPCWVHGPIRPALRTRRWSGSPAARPRRLARCTCRGSSRGPS